MLIIIISPPHLTGPRQRGHVTSTFCALHVAAHSPRHLTWSSCEHFAMRVKGLRCEGLSKQMQHSPPPPPPPSSAPTAAASAAFAGAPSSPPPRIIRTTSSLTLLAPPSLRLRRWFLLPCCSSPSLARTARSCSFSSSESVRADCGSASPAAVSSRADAHARRLIRHSARLERHAARSRSASGELTSRTPSPEDSSAACSVSITVVYRRSASSRLFRAYAALPASFSARSGASPPRALAAMACCERCTR
mmetsp:Transcript_27907/g.91331  ORF Transcript_27907/g.91331 Transcript_27907/m.91331 type:complete len:249 (+) Transcript_27907:31-777(+)